MSLALANPDCLFWRTRLFWRAQEIMRDPVVCADGYSYERGAIEEWLAGHATSPVTNEPLPHKLVISNHGLRDVVREYASRTLAAAATVA